MAQESEDPSELRMGCGGGGSHISPGLSKEQWGWGSHISLGLREERWGWGSHISPGLREEQSRVDPTLGKVVSTLFLEVSKPYWGLLQLQGCPRWRRGQPTALSTAASKLLLENVLQNRFTGKRRDQVLPSPTSPLPKHSILQWAPSPGSRPRGRAPPGVDNPPTWAPGVFGTEQHAVVHITLVKFFSSRFLFANRTPQGSPGYCSEFIHDSMSFS